jgi:N6-adenosine-specific RNA methylase IME4
VSYSVLVVDPPWSYGKDTGRTRTAEHHYETMGNNGKEINRKTGAGIESIINETPVPSMASENAHLYLWTTNPKLPFAFEVMRAWGFEYKTMLTWVKTTGMGSVHGGGMGWFFRGATEHVLFGVKGAKGIPSGMRRPNVIMGPTGAHSEKPVEFYSLLRSIYPADERMVDMFARKKHDRFTSWGNEAPQERPALNAEDVAEALRTNEQNHQRIEE